MRTILSLALFASLLPAQGVVVRRRVVAASCTTPTGTTLTESFGDGTTSCWASGPSTCGNTWTVGAGTGHSIIASPGTPPANTSCPNSLQMVLSGSSPAYIRLPIAGKPQATTMDVYAEVYVSVDAQGTYSDLPFLFISSDTAGASIRASVELRRGGGANIQIAANGTARVDDATTVSLTTWYKIHLHLETGTGMSSISVNDDTPTTFTQGAQDATYVLIGSPAYPTYTVVVGYLAIS